MSHVGSSISVVDADEIQKHQWLTVYDALESVPGVSVARSGGPGTTTSIKLRGNPAKHVVVLIDGIEANDVSSANRGPILDHITVDSIERIEVLRGNQSTLYGSESIGGVINIITKKGGKDRVSVSLEGGSFETVKGALDFSVGTEKIRFTGGFSRLHSGGISSAPKDDGYDEEDSYDNLTLYGRFDLNPMDNLHLAFIGRYVDTETNLDDWDQNGAFINRLMDDFNDTQETDSTYLRAEATLDLLDGFWSQTLGTGFTRHNREYMNFPDLGQDNLKPEEDDVFRGTLIKFDWQNTFNLHKTNKLIIGIETEKEIYEHEKNVTQSDGTNKNYQYEARTSAIYVEDQISLFDCWYTTLGARRDRHDTFGYHNTYRVTTALDINKIGTTLKASYGTGYKTPALFELYGRSSWDWFDGIVGDENLKPEKSRGWDIGFDQSLLKGKLRFGSTFFSTKTEDMITWESNQITWDSYYKNTQQAKAYGIESSLSAILPWNLDFNLTYTYTKSKDENTDKYLTYVPEHTAYANLGWSFNEDRGHLNLGVNYVGSRFTNATNTEKLKNYTVVNVSSSYKLSDNWQIYGRVENLLDRQYEEVADYDTPGIGAFLGIKVSF
ncbi:MAG: TonB-dependent receptor [Planctomycetes bacterium]|nr:TonB-dependent receptor [Planctomycetota bacterium]